MNIYLQRAWSDHITDITIADIDTVIIETQEMDDEHGAFWVGVNDEEYILETDKFLDMVLIVDDEETRFKAKNWEEVRYFYELLLAGRYEILVSYFKN
jgi:hypothetical protein